MLLGCFFAVIAGYYFQSWAAGVLCAVLASILLGWFFIWALPLTFWLTA